MRAIDADALEKYLSDAEIEATRQRKYVFASALNTICGNVRNFPTIEPEQKKGEWVGALEYCKHLEETTGERYQPSGLAGMIYCNQCWTASDRKSNYCRECGSFNKGTSYGDE